MNKLDNYAIVIERTGSSNYCAFLPDFGMDICYAIGRTQEEALAELQRKKEDIYYSFQSRGKNFPIPSPGHVIYNKPIIDTPLANVICDTGWRTILVSANSIIGVPWEGLFIRDSKVCYVKMGLRTNKVEEIENKDLMMIGWKLLWKNFGNNNTISCYGITPVFLNMIWMTLSVITVDEFRPILYGMNRVQELFNLALLEQEKNK